MWPFSTSWYFTASDPAPPGSWFYWSGTVLDQSSKKRRGRLRINGRKVFYFYRELEKYLFGKPEKVGPDIEVIRTVGAFEQNVSSGRSGDQEVCDVLRCEISLE